MKVIFEYVENENLKIDTISVIGSFNNYDINKGKMVKENNVWKLNYELSEGEHYYKFVINEELKLNDSTANIYLPDENEELWSVIIINDKDERMYNNIQYTTHIKEYNITCNVNEEEEVHNRKQFNIMSDKKVVTRFKFTNVTGLHSVTTAWYTPKGELMQTTENNLFTPKGQEDKPITMWFWMDLEDNERNYPLGNWKMKFFIDGEFILEDEFSLSKSNGYEFNGKIKY
ncbi:hypothetical protein [Clostridium ihumii]|uniref:hypothetical protein n=1 Tax=Clostridium ihumii TaxID=1470356 RepID=UPI003D358B03